MGSQNKFKDYGSKENNVPDQPPRSGDAGYRTMMQSEVLLRTTTRDWHIIRNAFRAITAGVTCDGGGHGYGDERGHGDGHGNDHIATIPDMDTNTMVRNSKESMSAFPRESAGWR